MTYPGRCLVCGVAHATCGTPSAGPALDLPERMERPDMAEQGEKERRWHNSGSDRRPLWGLYDMYPTDRRYAASEPWTPGQRGPAKPGRVEDVPEQPETPEADNKAATPGRPVRAPRKTTRGKATT